MSLGKKDIIHNISSKAQISQLNSRRIFDSILDLIKSHSKSKIIKLSNFGSFQTKITPARSGRNPKTGEIFKERKDWENKGFKNEDMAQDVKVIMPALDLFSKTK